MRGNRGFTLVEIIVVVGLILLVSGGGLAAFTNMRDKRQIYNEAKLVEQQLRVAQRRSLAGEKPVECNGIDMDGYEVVFGADGITVGAVCEGVVPPVVSFGLEKSGITTSVGSVRFLSVKGVASSNVIVDVCQNGGGVMYRITINEAGGISGPEEVDGGC